MLENINIVAIIVAAIASFVFSMLWYGPLFGKVWVKLANMTQEQIEEGKKKGMVGTMIVAFIQTIVFAVGVALAVDLVGATDISEALTVSFAIWLTFILTITLSPVLWMGKTVKHWAFDNAYNFCNLLIIATTIAYWQ